MLHFHVTKHKSKINLDLFLNLSLDKDQKITLAIHVLMMKKEGPQPHTTSDWIRHDDEEKEVDGRSSSKARRPQK